MKYFGVCCIFLFHVQGTHMWTPSPPQAVAGVRLAPLLQGPRAWTHPPARSKVACCCCICDLVAPTMENTIHLCYSEEKKGREGLWTPLPMLFLFFSTRLHTQPRSRPFVRYRNRNCGSMWLLARNTRLVSLSHTHTLYNGETRSDCPTYT